MKFIEKMLDAFNMENWESKNALDSMKFPNRNVSLSNITQDAKKNNVYVACKEMSVAEAYKKLERANKLADTANKTIDRIEFFNSIEEMKEILRELSEYEGKLPFIGSPSADLRNLEQIEQNQLELLEKRIAEKETENMHQSIRENHPLNYYDVGISKQKQIKDNAKSKSKRLSKYDLERYAIECNAYVVREERKNSND